MALAHIRKQPEVVPSNLRPSASICGFGPFIPIGGEILFRPAPFVVCPKDGVDKSL